MADPEPYILSPDELGDDMVKLYVGVAPHGKQFTVHKKLLCNRVKFFEAGFMTGFVESIDNTMRLPDDSPDAFSVLINYVYRGSVPKCPIPRGTPGKRKETREYMLTMVESFILGEKLCLAGFMNLVMDELTAGQRDFRAFPISHAAYIYDNTNVNSRLRRLVALTTATSINFRPILEHLGTPYPASEDIMIKAAERHIDLIKDIPDLVADVFKLGLHQKGKVTACHFHVHAEGEVCYLASMDN